MAVFSPYSNWHTQICGAFAILALLFAFLYIIMGYTKRQIIFYKLFAGFFALLQFTNVLSVSEDYSMFILALSTASFGLILVIMLHPNLSKISLFAMCTIVSVINLIALVFHIISSLPFLPFIDNMYEIILFFKSSANFLLSVILGIISIAKYVDKKNSDSSK